VDPNQSERITGKAPQSNSSAPDQQHLSRTLNTHHKQPAGGAVPSEQQEESFVLEKYGVARTNDHGLIQYRMAGSSENNLLFEANPGTAEFAQSKRKLQELTQAKVNDLKSKFHVSFSTEGENAVRPWVASKQDPNKSVPGPMLHARAPRLSELMGVEAALRGSQPSQFLGTKGQSGLKFYFLKTPTYGKDTHDAGLWASDERNKPSVFFEPDSWADRPITAADAIQKGTNIKASFEALASHEIAHNAEWNMGLWDLDKLKPIAEQIGWTISTEVPPYWLLKGRSGEFYRLTDAGLSDDKDWIRCDVKGNALDQSGQIVDENNAAATHLTKEEVRERALVRPPTDYFTAPDEMLADSLMLYRVGDLGRKELIKSGSQLYSVVKNLDQSEIDSRFGTAADGSPKKVRLPNGDLIDNNVQSRQIVANFDQSLM
jgi:hypothetical protein